MNATCLTKKETNGDPAINSSWFVPDPLCHEPNPIVQAPHSGTFTHHTMLFRVGFTLAGLIFGMIYGWNYFPEHWQIWLASGICGGALGIAVIVFEHMTHRIPSSDMLPIAQSLSIGIVIASLFSWLMTMIFPFSTPLVSSISLAGLLAFPYLTLAIQHRALRDAHKPRTPPEYLHTDGPHAPSTKIIDTSAIIDGRIFDLCQTGFVEGLLLIPQFVLGELHYIADSHHSWKRARGKRGLETLAQLKKISTLQVQIIEEDFPDVPEVDDKLVRLAQQCQAKIITNDWNLTKVASLQGVKYLNVNQLSHQLKPPVLPGEVIRVFINKEGDLPGQGVAHLDDGTMVVVDQARDYIRETVDVMITKFMQTHSGRILFGARH